MRAAPLFPGLKRTSLTKWLSDGIPQRLPPFLESSRQHFGPRMLYVGPAHSHLSSMSTLLLPECQQLDLSGCDCCYRTNDLKAGGALGEDRCLLLMVFPHSSMVVGAVVPMVSRVEEGMSCKGGASR